MSDLAKASCLSLSTIRRLESDVHGPGPRNLRCVLDAMRHAGVRFVRTEADVIAVGKS